MRYWAQHLRPYSAVWPYHTYRIWPCWAGQKYSCTVRSIGSLRQSISFSPVQFLYQVCPDKLDIILHLLPMHIYFPFHNPECQKSVVYTIGISYLFAFSASQCTLDLDNCNDSYICIGIVHLYKHILYLCQSLSFQDKKRTSIDYHHLHLNRHHQHRWLSDSFVARWGWRLHCYWQMSNQPW